MPFLSKELLLDSIILCEHVPGCQLESQLLEQHGLGSQFPRSFQDLPVTPPSDPLPPLRVGTLSIPVPLHPPSCLLSATPLRPWGEAQPLLYLASLQRQPLKVLFCKFVIYFTEYGSGSQILSFCNIKHHIVIL